ncbi:MAG: LamG domain-containing protein [Phycisphaerae bacterium]|nr:LamG domain-containing protein [Phycisphaerae bacterium]
MKRRLQKLIIGITVISIVTPLPADIVAQWKLDEGSGTTANDSIGNHLGTLYGNPLPTWAAGYTGISPDTCVSLNPDVTNQYVGVDHSADLDFGISSDFSISAWIKTSYSLGNQRIVFKKNDLFEGYTLTVVATTGKARLNIKGVGQSSAVYVDSITTVTDGQWHHIVGVRDADANINMTALQGLKKMESECR